MIVAKDDLNAIINGCIRNDRRSQQSVYQLLYGKMMAVCLRYTHNPDEAKDILQDGFIKVFKNIEKFNFDGSFEGWVRRIMVNTAIDYFRRSKALVLLQSDARPIESYEGTVADEVEENQPAYEELNLEVGDVVNAMQQLSPAYRTVFNLYVFEDYSHKDIADTLGISIGTSKSNLAKARANLKKILQKEVTANHEE